MNGSELGRQFERMVFNYMDGLGTEPVRTGIEHLGMKLGDSPLEVLLRNHPDGIATSKEGSFYWESKWRPTIHKVAFESYLKWRAFAPVWIFVCDNRTGLCYTSRVQHLPFKSGAEQASKYPNDPYKRDADGWIFPHGENAHGSGKPYKIIDVHQMHPLPDLAGPCEERQT